ncbi:MAG: hypothetical protein QNJ40_08735 [Xanthomonadales bacterium]|nr:hypothetical protein [Xanthomonadales bacterium]
MNARVIVVPLVSLLFIFAAGAAEKGKPELEKPIQLSEKTRLAFDRSPERAQVHQHADGMKVVEFNGTRQMVMMARIGPDGTVETFCTDSEHQAHQFLTGEALPGEEK